MCNNPNIDLVNINAYIKFGEIMSVCSQDIERKRNSGTNVRKMMCNYPHVDLVNINTYTIFCEILSICSQDI